MNSIARPTIVYALGLSEASLSLIKGCQGPVETVCPDHLTEIDPLNEGALWTSLPSWLELTPEQKFQLAGTAKILVLSPSETVYDLELPGELSFAAITVEPLDAHKVQKAANKALAEQNIYKDAQRMTREIMLERELLERKSANLRFLLQFLAESSGLSDIDRLLNIAAQNIDKLLPVKNLGAFIWHDGNDDASMHMFIPARRSASHVWKEWEAALLDAGRNLGYSSEGGSYVFHSLDLGESANERPELSLAIPLKANDSALGVVIIGMNEECTFGRDTLEVLEAAMNHLALSLKNSWLNEQLKKLAGPDTFAGQYKEPVFA